MVTARKQTRKSRAESGEQRVVKEKFMDERRQRIQAKPLVPMSEKQREYIKVIKEKPVVIATGFAGTSKAQPLRSLVLTETGWKKMGDITTGDIVVTPDNKTAKVLQTFDFCDKPVWKFTFASGRQVESCEDHLWLTRKTSKTARGKSTDFKVHTTKQIVADISSYNHAIPLCAAIGKDVDVDFFIPPYLMGLLIAEGCFRTGVSFTTADKEIVEKFEEYANERNLKIVKLPSQYDYAIRDAGKGNKNRVKEEIRRLGLDMKFSYEKFIPPEYLEGSVRQKFELLRGLMDGDGSSATTRRKQSTNAYYSTTSEVLADQIYTLAASLGFYVNKKQRINTYTYKGEKRVGRESYSVYMNHPTPKCMFNLERKKVGCSDAYQGGKYQIADRIVSAEFVGDEDVRCILIDSEDHLYLTDQYIVTHNTYIPTVMAADMYKTGEIDKIIVTRPAVSSSKSMGYFKGSETEKMSVWLQAVIPILKDRLGAAELEIAIAAKDIEFIPLETIKGMSINNAWLLVEEASDLTKEEVIKIVTRMGKNSRLTLSGDLRQSELKETSGLKWLVDFVQRHNLSKNFGFIDFNDVNDIVRSDAVREFIVCLVRDEKRDL